MISFTLLVPSYSRILSSPGILPPKSVLSYLYLIYLNVNVTLDIDTPGEI